MGETAYLEGLLYIAFVVLCYVFYRWGKSTDENQHLDEDLVLALDDHFNRRGDKDSQLYLLLCSRNWILIGFTAREMYGALLTELG